MIIRLVSLMKWMERLMTWLDWFVVGIRLPFHLILLFIRFGKRGMVLDLFHYRKQNLGSVSAMYAVNRPWGPVDRRHWVRFPGTWRDFCSCIFSYNCRSTGQGLGRPGTHGGCRPDSFRSTGPSMYGVDWPRARSTRPTVKTLFQGFCLPYFWWL